MKDVDTKGDFPALPEGRYDLVVEETEIAFSKKKGNEMIKATFRVINNAKFGKRKLFVYFTLTPQALWKLKQYTEAAAPELNERDEIESEELAQELVGTKANVYAEVVVDDYGEKNELNGWKPIKETVKSEGAFE